MQLTWSPDPQVPDLSSHLSTELTRPHGHHSSPDGLPSSEKDAVLSSACVVLVTFLDTCHVCFAHLVLRCTWQHTRPVLGVQ